MESGTVSKAIEQAQTKVEGYNFDIRKHVVQYDDVMNRHRELIYAERRKILEGTDIRSNVTEMIETDVEAAFDDQLLRGSDERGAGPLLAALQPVDRPFALSHPAIVSAEISSDDFIRNS